MFNRNIKDHILSLQLQYKSAESEVKPKQYSYDKLFPGDKICILETKRKIWEEGAIIRETDQTNQYQILFSNGGVANGKQLIIFLRLVDSFIIFTVNVDSYKYYCYGYLIVQEPGAGQVDWTHGGTPIELTKLTY